MRALALAVAALLCAPAAASARSFTLEYRWADTSWGAVPWFPAHYEDAGAGLIGETGPWYATTFTPGDGLRIVPTGNNGAAYDRVRGIWFLGAPGGARFNRVVFDDVRGHVDEGQILRLEVMTYDGDASGPGAIRDYITNGQNINEDVTLTSSPAIEAGLVSIWMYMRPCQAPDPPCTPVDPSQGSFIAVRGVTATLDDPSDPVVTLDAGGADQGWTNARRVTLTVSATDPESGVAELTGRGPGGRSLRFARNREDRRNVAARGRSEPNREPFQAATRTISLPRSGTFRLRVRAENGARMRADASTVVRVDRDRPRGLRVSASGGRLALEATDARSGVAELAAVVDGVRLVGFACAADTCPRRAESSGLALPQRRSVAVRVSASDRAGNTATVRRTVRGPRQSTLAAVPDACRGRAFTRFLSGRRALRGDQTAEVLLGDRRDDALDGSGGDDCVAGGRGDDQLFGGSGADVLEGGAGRDELDAGSGDDFVDTRDGQPDEVDCGSGEDRARVDAGDDAGNCEVLL